MLLQMSLFCSFLWLSNIQLFICSTSFLSIPLSMGIQVPCPGYYEQHSNEHWGACILSNHVFSPDIRAGVGLLDHMLALFLVF